MAELDQRTPFEMTYNPIVRKYIERYLKYGTARLSRMMAHGQYYFPMFEEHLDKYDMPLEIKYLAVVESALNPKARSYVGRDWFMAVHVQYRKNVRPQGEQLR